MEFQNHKFVHHHNQWFIWESAWDSFRPIQAFAWNGTRFEIDDQLYCKNPFDQFYGYGSLEMKVLSQQLNIRYKDATYIQQCPIIGQSEWWFDRDIVLTKCCPRDKVTWKRYVKNHYRTLRHLTRNKFTRRNRKDV